MLNMIKQMLKVREEEFKLNLCYVIVGFLMLVFFMTIFSVVGKDIKVVTIDTVGTKGSWLVFSIKILMDIYTFPVKYNQAIVMGRIRRNFMIAYIAVSIIQSIMMIIVISVMHFIEWGSYIIIFPQAQVNPDFIFSSNPMLIGLSFVGVISIPIIIGTITLKLGIKAYWMIFGIVMFFDIAIINIKELAEKQPNIFMGKEINGVFRFVLHSPGISCWIGIGVLVIALILAIISAQKQEVRLQLL